MREGDTAVLQGIRDQGLGPSAPSDLASSASCLASLGQIRNSRAETHSFAHYASSRFLLRRTAHWADTGYDAQWGA